jgi:hypothetical protein
MSLIVSLLKTSPMTDRWLVFNSLFPVLWIVVVATVLALVFVWLEWKKDYPFKLLRSFAQIVAVASVTILILRPAIKKEYDGKQTILLTPNFSREQVDSLLSLYPKSKLIRTSGTVAYRDAGVEDVLDEITGVIYVAGDGFNPAELDEISGKEFIYVSSPKPNGIVSIIPEQQPRVNQITEIHVGVNGDAAKILVKSPGRIEDSVQVNQKTGASVLRIRPKQAGQFLYSIITKDQNGSVIEQQPLPLDVLPEQKLRILILQDYPTAEVRYLKNFLADRGHTITLRYQLSRNIYRHEFANSEQKKINRIESEMLSDFDLVVADADVLKKISAGERKQLTTSLRQGLGLLILFNESPQQNKSLDDVLGISFVATKTDTAYVPIVSGTTTMVRTLGATALPEESFTPLLQTADRKILSGYRFHGIGKSGFNVTTETYRFLIEGNEGAYAAIWTPLLSQLSRKKQENFSIHILTEQPIYTDEPVSIEILAASGKPSLIADSMRIALTEDVLIDDRWIGKAWFDKPGWHTLTKPGDSTVVNLYVYKNDELKSVRLHNQQRLNSLRQVSKDRQPVGASVSYEPISSAWFFISFLIAAGFLWLSPKL